MTIEVIILIICLLSSGFFSGTEAAFFSVSKLDLEQLKKKKKKNIKYLEKLKKDPHRFIIAVLIGNNVVNILASALATKIALEHFGNAGVAIATGLMTLFVLVFGEIIPKAYCAAKSRRVSLASSRFLDTMATVLTPFIFVLDKITKFVLKILGVKNTHGADSITEEEVLDVVEMGAQDGAINKTEKEFITKVLEFDETIVEEIMISKENTTIAIEDESVNDVLRRMIKSGFSRLPVFKKDEKTIAGVIHIKDLLKTTLRKRPARTIANLVSEPYVVPESKKINTLFNGFKKKQVHMAIVVNEYGSYEGVITLEDVIEEIVGEVQDESDIEISSIKKIGPDSFLVQGDCYIEDFNKKTGLRIPESDDFETVGGYIITYIGRIPNKEESITIKGVEFVVKDVTHSKINMVKVIKQSRKKIK